MDISILKDREELRDYFKNPETFDYSSLSPTFKDSIHGILRGACVSEDIDLINFLTDQVNIPIDAYDDLALRIAKYHNKEKVIKHIMKIKNPLVKDIKFLKKTREIVSRKGIIHFQRYHLFSTPFFHCYIHKIYQKDKDLHLHNHPWNFFSLILKGSYIEETPYKRNIKKLGSIGFGTKKYFHKIKEIISPTTTLFFTGVKHHDWGYLVDDKIINHIEYRKSKKTFSH